MCKDNDKTETISSLIRYLEWVNKLPQQGRYVFRGVSSKTYKIEPSTYRRLRKKGTNSENNDVNNPNRLLHINKEMIDEANLHRHGWENEVPKSDLNLLADLQHKGAATCLIDFTKNPLVALWMACRASSKGSIEGKVYAVDISSHLKFKPVSIKDSSDNEKQISDYFQYHETEGYQLYQWQPNYQNNRMRAQQSIFLFGGATISEYKTCLIDKNKKQSILISLENMAGITGDVLFPDTEGFATQRAESKPYIDPDDPSESLATSYLERGRQASSEGKIEEALNSYTSGIAIQPSEKLLHDLYKGRALVYYNEETYDKTISDCREVIENNPTDESALLLQGRAYSDSGEKHDAIRVFEQVVSLNPGNDEAYFRLSIIQSDIGDDRNCLDNLNNAISLKSENPIYRYWRGKLIHKLERYEEAIRDFNEAIKFQSDNPNTYYWRGMSKYSLQQYKEAIEDFDLAIILGIDDPFPYFRRGICKARLGENESAKIDLQTAHEYAEINENTHLVSIIEHYQDLID